MISKAILLAAGRGTRLGALAETTPKPLLVVGGRPMIVHILDGLHRAGVDDVLIVTGHLGDIVERELGNGAHSGMHIEYVRQRELDGTARALALGRDFVAAERFFFGWGDILVRPENYRRVLRAAWDEDLAAVLAINEVEDPASGAAVYVDDGFRVQRMVEKPPPGTSSTHWNNAGFGVLGPAVWPAIASLAPSSRGEYELPQAIADMVATGAAVRAVPVESLWFDIGTPEQLDAAREAYRR